MGVFAVYHTLMLVDDEEMILRGLQEIIDWNGLGFRIAGAYRNGLEALQAFQEQPCDVVMADVKMPLMDGIQLGQKIRETGFSETQIIFMSGYEDFQYAQAATKIGAVDYILKPMDPEKIDGTLQRLHEKLEAKAKRNERLKMLESRAQNNLTASIYRLLHLVLYGAEHRPLENDPAMEMLEEFLDGRLMTFCTLHFIDTQTADAQAAWNYSQARGSVLSVIEEELTRTGSGMVADHSSMLVPFVVFSGTGDEAREIAGRLKELIEASCGIAVMLGIGSSTRDIRELKKSYASSVESLSGISMMGTDDLISFVKLKSLNEAIKLKNPAQVDSVLQELYLPLESAGVGAAQKRQIVRLIGYAAYMTLVEMGFSQTDLDRKFDALFSICQTEKIKQIYHETVSLIRDEITQTDRKAQSLCGQIIEYIDRHFAEQITVKELSEQFFFSPNYIGNLFRKTMGKGIKEYLIDIRLKAADRLIADNRYKLYEISKLVGYQDYEYFRKLYKKHRGRNPSD